jgi:hypothetical protein
MLQNSRSQILPNPRALADPNIIEPEVPSIQSWIREARLAKFEPDRLDILHEAPPVGICSRAAVTAQNYPTRRNGDRSSV